MAEPERFIFLESDFHAQQSLERARVALRRLTLEGGKSSQIAVRRPYRGIQIKEDTYATLRVVDGDNRVLPLISSSAYTGDPGQVDDYADFVMQRVEQQRTEKQQIIETFGDSYVFFFGERPTVLTISGMLINTADFNWRAQFWENYEHHLRGSKLVQRNARVYLAYDTVVVEGYPFAASAVDDSELPYGIPFTMQLLVTNYYDFSNVGTTLFPGQGSNMSSLLDAANAELDKTRENYVSSTQAVREFALEAAGGGVGAQLREALKVVDDPLGSLASAAGLPPINRIKAALMGRVIRVPAGVAGSVLAIGEAQFAVGSTRSGDNIGVKAFDAATGQFKTLTGSVKIRAPSLSRFAAVGRLRGRFSDNTDEYPLGRSGEQRRLVDLVAELGGGHTAAFEKRSAERTARQAIEDKALVALEASRTSDDVLQGMAVAVNFLRFGFALASTTIKTAENVAADDQLAVDLLLHSLGMDGLDDINFKPALF